MFEHYFRFDDAESSMARYRGEVSSQQAFNSGAPATSPDYDADVPGDADWGPAGLNAAYEPSKRTDSKTKFTELREVWCGAGVAAQSSMKDAVDLAVRRASAPVAGHVCSNRAWQRPTELSVLKIKYDTLAGQLSSVFSGYDTWRLSARKQANDITNLRASLNTSKKE